LFLIVDFHYHGHAQQVMFDALPLGATKLIYIRNQITTFIPIIIPQQG
jgi:hypothetical protein